MFLDCARNHSPREKANGVDTNCKARQVYRTFQQQDNSKCFTWQKHNKEAHGSDILKGKGKKTGTTDFRGFCIHTVFWKLVPD